LNELSQKFCNDDDSSKMQLVEIGPRFSMTIVRIFDGSLGGKTLFSNPFYISPSAMRKKNYDAFIERRNKKDKVDAEFKDLTENAKGKDRDHAWLYE